MGLLEAREMGTKLFIYKREKLLKRTQGRKEGLSYTQQERRVSLTHSRHEPGGSSLASLCHTEFLWRAGFVFMLHSVIILDMII